MGVFGSYTDGSNVEQIVCQGATNLLYFTYEPIDRGCRVSPTESRPRGYLEEVPAAPLRNHMTMRVRQGVNYKPEV